MAAALASAAALDALRTAPSHRSPVQRAALESWARQVVKLEAFYDLLLIIFISLLVVVSSWSFNEVAEDIVVRPVADMLRVVSKVGRSLDMLKRDAQAWLVTYPAGGIRC